jgi:hypothetical protein
MIRNGITTVNWEAVNSYCRRMEHGQGAPIPGWYTYAGDGVYLNSNGEEVSFDEISNNYVLPNAGITYKTVITETTDYEIASAYFNPSEGEYGVDQLTLYVEWKKITKTEYSLVPVGGGDPFIDVELNIKFGLAISEKLKIFSFGEEFKANAISFDYMTFNWSSTTSHIKYTPYRTASSSFSLGAIGLYGGVKQDWGQMQFIPYGQLGLIYLERGAPTRFNIIDIGYMYGFGFDFKVTISPGKFINSYIKQQSDWNDKVGWPIYPFLH